MTSSRIRVGGCGGTDQVRRQSGRGEYHIQPIHFVYGKNKVICTADDIDVLAAHVVPLDVWYVVPVAARVMGTSLRLYPSDGCKTARFEKYRGLGICFVEKAQRWRATVSLSGQ